MVYPELLPLMRTPRLPVVDWTEAPADLNGLVRFAERRNLVSARVPSHFDWPVLIYQTIRHNSPVTVSYFLSYSIDQIPSWEANCFSASQKIHRILYNPNIYNGIYKCPTVSILSQIDPVHTTTSQFLKIHLNTSSILPFTAGSCESSLSFRFPHQNPVCTSSLPQMCYMPLPFHYSRFDNRKILGEE